MSNLRPRVLFFGMEGAFSATVLMALLEKDQFDICAIVLPASPLFEKSPPVIVRREAPSTRRAPLPVLAAIPSLLQLAHTRLIPVWEVQRLSHPETLSTLTSYHPDLLCVACFSQRIPQALLALPHLAALNVHPSLLPVNRGPVPLFWTFREGHALSGVTIHILESTLDSGDILAQTAFPVPDGISYAQLDALTAQKGGELLAQTIVRLAHGDAVREPQDEAKSSYHSFPEPEDFVAQPLSWGAQHLYNFIQGVGSWDGPVLLRSANDSLATVQAISYSIQDKILPSFLRTSEPVVYQQGTAWVRCQDGWVQVVVSSLT